MIYPLSHQTQPTSNTCMVTCLAMLLDVDVNDIVDEFHQAFADSELTIGDVLCANGVPFITGRGINQCPTIFYDYVYVLCVPSPVKTGILHQILMDSRNQTLTVYDPLKGTGRRYYTMDPEDKSPLAIKLESWVVDYIVDPFEIGIYRG